MPGRLLKFVVCCTFCALIGALSAAGFARAADDIGKASATQPIRSLQPFVDSVYMVQQDGGYLGKDGGKILPAFTQAAVDAFKK